MWIVVTGPDTPLPSIFMHLVVSLTLPPRAVAFTWNGIHNLTRRKTRDYSSETTSLLCCYCDLLETDISLVYVNDNENMNEQMKYKSFNESYKLMHMNGEKVSL